MTGIGAILAFKRTHKGLDLPSTGPALQNRQGMPLNCNSVPAARQHISGPIIASAQHAGDVQVLFCFELTVASMVRTGYFASLYFWIDLAATLSMLLDITRLMDLIFNQSTMAGSPALTRLVQNRVSALT